MITTKFRAATALVAAAAIVLVGSTAAVADHNRSTANSFVVSGNAATWTVVTGWIADESDYMVSDTLGDTLEVTQLAAYGDAPNSGTGTGVELTLSSYSEDSSNGLFDRTTEVLTGDLSSLADGIYQVYADTCCRVFTDNGGSDGFAVWVTFTKIGSTYNVGPIGSSEAPVTLINATGDTVVNYAMTDSEAITYSLGTDVNDPYFGFDPIPCSTFAGSTLTVGPSHCAPGDDFATIFAAGSWWGAEVIAVDATGNDSATYSMLHVAGPPSVGVNFAGEYGSSNGTVRFQVYDNNGEVITSWNVNCVNQADAGDVVSATATNLDEGGIDVSGLTVGEVYDCDVTGTNAAGTDTDSGTIGPVVEHYIDLSSALAVGQVLSGKSVTITARDVTDGENWTLTQDAVELASAAPVNNAIDEPVFISTDACVAGAHVLTATAFGDNFEETMTDSVWYTLDANCVITAFSLTAPGTPVLAASGANLSPVVPGAAALALMGGLALLVIRRRKHASVV